MQEAIKMAKKEIRTTRKPRGSIDPAVVEKISRRFGAGETMVQIAKDYDVTPPTILYHLKKKRPALKRVKAAKANGGAKGKSRVTSIVQPVVAPVEPITRPVTRSVAVEEVIVVFKGDMLAELKHGLDDTIDRMIRLRAALFPER
jgi:hypothetical protein